MNKQETRTNGKHDTPPEEVNYLTPAGYTVTLESLDQLITVQGYPCIDGGTVERDGERVRLMVRYDNKPDLAEKVALWICEWDTYQQSKDANLARYVPGLCETEAASTAAYNEKSRYDAEFEHMMETGHSRVPRPVDENFRTISSELNNQYPRAALYLRAEGFTYSDNLHKYSAGKKAMALLTEGGDIDTVESILKNWLPESAMWD
jgi:hypothetical protein